MIIIKCEACGGNELKRLGNVYECSYCGSKYVLDKSENLISRELTEAKIVTLLGKSIQLHEADRFGEELEVLTQALEMDENNTRILVNLGRCYRCLNFPDRGIECYQKTIELNPNEGAAYTNMGTIHLLRQNYEEAAKCYEKGLPILDKATFDYWIAYANYAIPVARLGDPEKTEKMIKEAVAHGYQNGERARQLAGIEPKSLVSRIKRLFSSMIFV